jgi:amino acid transporter
MAAPPALHRRLTLRDLVVYGLLFIGPLAPVGVFGVLDARADGAVALVYLVATVAMAFTAWSYAEMSRVVPHAGSVFAYATAGLGGTAGFFAGWLAMLDYLLIPSVAYLFSGIAMHALVPAVPAWIFTVAAFAATTALNLRGVGVAARVGFVVLLIELAALAVFLVAAAVVLATDGPSRPWLSPLAGLTAIDQSMILGAASIAVLSLEGGETECDLRHGQRPNDRAAGAAENN